MEVYNFKANRFKFLKIEGDSFCFPLFVLESLAEDNIDICIINEKDEEMWLNPVDYYVFRESDDLDDTFYKVCHFKFKKTDINYRKLSPTDKALLTRFHYTWLNIPKFYDYLTSESFSQLLSVIAKLRLNNKNITPERDKVFSIFNQPLSKDILINLPETLTYNDKIPMIEEWKPFLDAIRTFQI